MNPNKRPLVISHAACKGHAPENTLAGIRLALGFGIDAIEVDVHATADGVPVLLHDNTLDRTTDRAGDVHTMPLAEVREADAGGEPVPTLEESLELTAGRAQLLIEIKQPGIEERVVDAVHKASARDSVAFCSFLPSTAERLRELEPGIPTFALEQWSTARLDSAKPNFVHFSLVTRELADEIRTHSGKLYVWTVDDEPEMRRLIGLGVDGICTNYPDRLQRIFKAPNSPY